MSICEIEFVPQRCVECKHATLKATADRVCGYNIYCTKHNYAPLNSNGETCTDYEKRIDESKITVPVTELGDETVPIGVLEPETSTLENADPNDLSHLSSWGYDNLYPNNATLKKLKEKYGNYISDSFLDRNFLSESSVHLFQKELKALKQHKTLTPYSIASNFTLLTKFLQSRVPDQFPALLVNLITCHQFLLCVNALTAHMWWDDEVSRMVRLYEDDMLMVFAWDANLYKSVIFEPYIQNTATLIYGLCEHDPMAFGYRRKAAEIANQSTWTLWWRQANHDKNPMYGNVKVYKFKKKIGQFFRTTFWVLKGLVLG